MGLPADWAEVVRAGIEGSDERAAIQGEGRNGAITPADAAAALRHALHSGALSADFVLPDHWKRLDVANIQQWNCEPLRPIVDGFLARGQLAWLAAQSQTGKTLFGLYLARKVLHPGTLFGRAITPVDRVDYYLLEDPDRRARDRILDTDHEFPPLESGRFIIHVSPGFNLTDPRMFDWFERILRAGNGNVLSFLDTYQKATPGLSSFDDEKQGVILHKLADLTRRLDITLLVNDHFRKSGNGNGKMKNRDLTIDDLKGTGGKAQNADTVALLDRTPDRKQIRFQVSSKDFDNPIRVLLNVALQGSKDPKFSYAGDLDQLGAYAQSRAQENQQKILAVLKAGEWLSSGDVAAATNMSDPTARRHLKSLISAGKVDEAGSGRWKKYTAIAQSQEKDV